MLKRCVALLLIISLFATSFQRFFVYAGFELNRDFIAQNLCVNKSRPWMHCNGHCFFMRKVKEAQQREAINEREVQKQLYQEIYVLSNTTVVFHTSLLSIISTLYTYGLPVKCLAKLFRPPRYFS